MKKTAVVTTTIRVPTFLEGVRKNAVFYNKDNICFIVIGDKKTPPEAQKYCETLSDKYPFKVSYYGIEEQKNRLKDYPRLLEMMPYNSGSRKLVGNFIAYLEGYDVLVMLDDDNLVTNHDFFGCHGIVGDEVAMDLIQTPSGWYNICESLIEQHNIPFYPRSYPWSKRFAVKEVPTRQKSTGKVAVNNGLVLEDPDIDAITRLSWPIRVVGVRAEFMPRFGLQPGTWSSWNNQNTAISRELIPVFFTPPLTGRNSDIWTSYLICKLAEHMEQVIAYGQPLVHQFRNAHNLWVDLEDERINNRATDRFIDLLRSVSLSGNDYLSSLGELLTKCLSKIVEIDDVADDEREMMNGFFSEYKIWHSLF